MINQRIKQVYFMERINPPSSSSVMEMFPSQYHIHNKCNTTKMHRIITIETEMMDSQMVVLRNLRESIRHCRSSRMLREIVHS